jgi:hypothetical protein
VGASGSDCQVEQDLAHLLSPAAGDGELGPRQRFIP